jgi:hypothetical protein
VALVELGLFLPGNSFVGGKNKKSLDANGGAEAL